MFLCGTLFTINITFTQIPHTPEKDTDLNLYVFKKKYSLNKPNTKDQKVINYINVPLYKFKHTRRPTKPQQHEKLITTQCRSSLNVSDDSLEN